MAKSSSGPAKADLKLPPCPGCSKCGVIDEGIPGGKLFAYIGGAYYCRRCFYDKDGPGATWPRPALPYLSVKDAEHRAPRARRSSREVKP